jgi:hypothetical protein
MKKYMVFVMSLSIVNCFLEGSHNLPVADTKSSKNMVAAALIAVTAVPSYMYYRWSSANQKEAQKTWYARIRDTWSNFWNRSTISKSNECDSRFKEEFEQHKQIPWHYADRKKKLIGNNKAFEQFVIKFGFTEDEENSVIVPNEVFIYTHPIKGGSGNVYNADFYNQKYFFKDTDYTRIINRERAEKIIKNHNLKYIGTPKKYIALVGDCWYVIAEKVHPLSFEKHKLRFDELDEIITFITLTKYRDFAGDINSINIVRDSMSSKIMFIDTEDRSFNLSSTDIQTDKGILCALKNFLIRIKAIDNNTASKLDEAINNASDEYIKDEANLSQKTDLDDTQINIKNISDYFKNFSQLQEKWYNSFSNSKQFLRN